MQRSVFFLTLVGLAALAWAARSRCHRLHPSVISARARFVSWPRLGRSKPWHSVAGPGKPGKRSYPLCDLDRDGDGLSNEAEAQLGSNPDLRDSDGNGTPDGAEDADHDGVSNAAEVAAARRDAIRAPPGSLACRRTLW